MQQADPADKWAAHFQSKPEVLCLERQRDHRWPDVGPVHGQITFSFQTQADAGRKDSYSCDYGGISYRLLCQKYHHCQM